MKNIKRFIALLKVILILGIAGLLLIPLVFAFSNDITVDGQIVKEWTALLISKVLINTVVYICFLIAIYKLRVAYQSFYKHKLFTEVMSKTFKEIGFLIIIAILIYIVFNFLIESFFTSIRTYGLNASYLIHLAAALFFFTLSTMIDLARKAQQENDLTI